MSVTVADFLVTRLSEWGVKRLFGYPGERSRATNSNFRRSAKASLPQWFAWLKSAASPAAHLL